MTIGKITERKLIVLSIVGARPQFIKAGAVSRAIAENNKTSAACAIVEKIVHTGQHYDDNMSKVFFDELDVPKPDYNLAVGSGQHGAQTGRMLERIEHVLLKEEPHCVLVYGDTNSTLAGALAAAKLHIRIAHVEAGPRSFNRSMPEEVNRVLTDHISSLLLCPTATAVENLETEGITQGVHQVGDVMYDCVLFYGEKAKSVAPGVLARFGVTSGSYFLATVHRAENTDDLSRLQSIFAAFAAVSRSSCPVLIPLHPRTRKKIAQIGLSPSDSIRIIEPVSYLEMLALESNACTILTDSGGVQKEAYWFRVPCINLRDETEWVETVETGWSTLAGADCGQIVESVRIAENALPEAWRPFYGDGHAASHISDVLCQCLGGC